jgi:hypothetical protein
VTKHKFNEEAGEELEMSNNAIIKKVCKWKDMTFGKNA